MNPFLPNLFALLVILFVLLANILWYYIKYALHKKGYETHLFWGHWSDIANLHRLIKKERDENQKRLYKFLLFALYSSLLLIIISFLMIPYSISHF